jgi:putative ABC transport system permease protein
MHRSAGRIGFIHSCTGRFKLHRSAFRYEECPDNATSLTGPRFLQSAAVGRTVRDGVDRLRSLPGVVSAAATCCVPLQPAGYRLLFRIFGRPLVNGPFHGIGAWSTTSPRYFDVLKIPINRGRAFTDRDDASSSPVVMINETMTRQFWVKGTIRSTHVLSSPRE